MCIRDRSTTGPPSPSAGPTTPSSSRRRKPPKDHCGAALAPPPEDHPPRGQPTPRWVRWSRTQHPQIRLGRLLFALRLTTLRIWEQHGCRALGSVHAVRVAWERAALTWLHTILPSGEPFRAWANDEFVAGDGSVNEVDLVLITPAGVSLVEIKSWLGRLSGDGTNVAAGAPRSGGQSGPPRQQEGSQVQVCLLYTSPSPRDRTRSRMPSSA